MKNKKCPCKKHCWDYKSGDCDNCDIGREINRLHRKIDRLQKKVKRYEQQKTVKAD